MKTFGKVFTFLIYLFLYAPLLVMIFFSFNKSRSISVFTGFSLYWYEDLLNNRQIGEALKNTLVLAFASSIFATLIGTLAALGIYHMKKKAVIKAYMSVTNIPMMNPDIITGVSLMLLFVFVGQLLNTQNSLGFGTLLIAHITFNIPYVILNVLPKLRQTDPHLLEAALDLGCTPIKAFFKVMLPAISSGIVSGLIMAFTLSLDDFVISYYTTGSDFQTLPTLVYSITKKSVKPSIYALFSIIFFTILLLLILMNVVQARAEKKNARKIS